MPDVSAEELEELKRLQLVEESVIAGLREQDFSEKAIELFRTRRNFILQEDPLRDQADVIGSYTGSCGDHIELYLDVEDDTIVNARYFTDGCPGAVTSAAALSVIIDGMAIDEARSLGVPDIVDFLEEGSRGLPKNMHDCAGIAVGSLRDAMAELGFE